MKVDQDIKAVIQAFCNANKGGGNINIVSIENINLGGNMQTQEGLMEEEKKLLGKEPLALLDVKPAIELVSDEKRVVQIPKISTDPQELKQEVFFSQEQKDNLYNLLSGFHGYSRMDALLYLLVTVCRERFTAEKAASWLWVSKERLLYYYKKFGFINIKKKEKRKTNSIWADGSEKD